jgi:C-terminal processing protease CtpA/Prc
MMKPDTSDIDLYTAPFRLEVLAPGTDHETVVVVESATPELAVGEQVLAINGVPVAKAIDAAEQIASGSTRRMRRWASARRLVDALGVEAGSQDLILTLKDRAVSLGRTVALTPRPGANSSASAIDPTGADLLKATVFPGGIGYLRIDGFSGSQMPFLLDAALDRLAGTQGLILDLRKNGGGDQSGNRILARLAAQNITRYRTSERLSQFVLSQRPEIFGLFQQSPDAPFALWHDLTVRAATDRRYAGKVFALTSPNCFSACDTFTSALKTNGLATVIGESTGGGTGTPLVFELPNSGMSFRYSVVRGHTAKDETIEGAGTLVDIALEPTLEERAARKDAQLLTTIALLKQALSGSEQPHPVPAAVESAVRALAPIWSQDLAIAPTWSDEAALQRLAPVDERE